MSHDATCMMQSYNNNFFFDGAYMITSSGSGVMSRAMSHYSGAVFHSESCNSDNRSATRAYAGPGDLTSH